MYNHLKYHIISFIAFLFIFQTVFAQDQFFNATFTSAHKIIKYKDTSPNGGKYVWEYGNWDIGRKNGEGLNSNGTDDRFRAIHIFDLTGLADDAVLKSAKLYITATNYETPGADNYTFVVRNFTKSTFATLETMYNNAGSEPELFSGIKYSSASNLEKSSSGLLSAVQSNLGDNEIAFAVQSHNESTNNSHAIIDLYLVITYQPKINLTVKNSFNGGVVYWQTGNPARNVNHNEILRIEKGSSQTFQSNTQTYNGKEYTTNNTWTINGSPFTGNPLSHIFNIDNSTIIAQYTEQVDITAANRNDGGNVKVDETVYSSGQTFHFTKNSEHDFEAWEQNYGGYYNVFKPSWHKWDMAGDQKLTALVEDYTVNNTGDYEAQLWQRYNFNTAINLLNGGSGGYLKINDVQTNTPSSSYALEEDQQKIEAPSQDITVSNKTITYNFLKWDDGNTTNPRTFTPTSHINRTAIMKGHLVSDNSQATGYNNSRCLVRTGDTRHLVYEENGLIYYTSSEDGVSWTKDKLISDSYPGNKNPSIAGGQGSINIIWEYRDPSNPGTVNICFRRKLGSVWQWFPYLFWFNQTRDARPVIAAGSDDNFLVAVCQGPDGLYWGSSYGTLS